MSQQALMDLQEACGGDSHERRRQALAELTALKKERGGAAFEPSLKSPSLLLDDSAVVRIIEASPQAAAFQQAVLKAELALAPELMLTDVSNVHWRLQRTDQLQADGWQLCLSRAAALVDHIEPDRHLQVEALALACHADRNCQGVL